MDDLIIFYFSLNTLCGGRNDLERFFSGETSGQTGISSRAAQARASEESTPVRIDWNKLADDILSHKPSATCLQSYVLGTSSIKQTVLVNRTCRCVLFDQVFNSNKQLKDFGKFFRPLLYGKIYYHPSTPYYVRLIKQMNQTFESLDEFVKFSREIQSIILPNYQKILSICNATLNTTILNATAVCSQLYSYKTTLSLMVLLTEFIACSEKNRFVAKNSEADMVREGQNNSATNTFLAGIEFLDDTDGSGGLPRHVRYKIRMVLDNVDSTFRTQDRYFSYAPRYSVPGSTKYHTFAFIYLQNALDRAIISAHTGVNVSYGVQTQQMPYPCWVNDRYSERKSR